MADTEEALREYAEREGLAEEEVDLEDRLVKEMIAQVLFQIVNEFYGKFERRFGSHVHLLDWALHLDEGTPHIHERHVFDCRNKYGELFQEIKIIYNFVGEIPAVTE